MSLGIQIEDWVYADAGTCWQDGLILGNGNLGVIAYAPYGLEWVLNKVDVFDGRVYRRGLVPHAQVMRRFLREGHKTVAFLNKLESPPPSSVEPVSKSAALLRLRFGEESGWAATRPHRVRQRLHLAEGTLDTELDLHLSHPRLRCIVPRDRNLFCVRLENVGAAVWDHLAELARPHDDDLKPPRWSAHDGMLVMEQTMPHGNARYAVALLVVPTKGPNRGDLFQRCVSPRYRVKASSRSQPQCGSLHGQIPQAGNADIFVSIHTSYEDRDPTTGAVNEVKCASRIGFIALERENRQWWKRFWERGWADFGAHKDIQRYWNFSLYETACLLGKAPVPGLYGLWYGPTSGPRPGVSASFYAQDQNVQMPMMPVFPLNHPELVEPFADTHLNVLATLRRNTKAVFGRRGVHLPLCMNPLGEAVTGGMYRYSLLAGVYSGLILVWAWRYTRDRTLLREKLYPLLRELVCFYAEAMKPGADARYHLDWEVPPEIFTMSRDVTAALALFKPCLETAIEAAALLHCDGKERRHWQDILARFPDFPRHSRGGWWAGADVPEDHYTQAAYVLYPFFPGECGDEPTAARTLDRMTAHDIEMSYADTQRRWHYKRSWAWFFPTVTRLRLGRRQDGWAALRDCLRLFSKPNGLFSHNPIIEADPRQTEANLRHIPKGKLRQADGLDSPLSEFRCYDAGSAATLNPNARRWVTPASEGSAALLFAATETLLQSHGGLIRLFPGVPRNFTGRFHHLLAQGGFEVSAEMRRGKLVRCEIRARVGSETRLLLPGRSRVAPIRLRRGQVWIYPRS